MIPLLFGQQALHEGQRAPRTIEAAHAARHGDVDSLARRLPVAFDRRAGELFDLGRLSAREARHAVTERLDTDEAL